VLGNRSIFNDKNSLFRSCFLPDPFVPRDTCETNLSIEKADYKLKCINYLEDVSFFKVIKVV
jgi:hypothetical protein